MPYNLPSIAAPQTTAAPSISPFAEPDAPEIVQANSPGLIKDLALAPVRGALDFGTSAYGLVDTLAFDALPDADFNFLGRSQTGAGRVVEDITEFALGFVPVAGAVGRLGRLGKAAKLVRSGTTAATEGGFIANTLKNSTRLTLTGDAVASGIAGALFYKDSEERLSNLIQKYPTLQNPVTEFLAKDGEETELQNRLENGLEQAGLGFLIGGPLVLSLKALKSARKTLIAGGTEAEAEAAARAVATPDAVEQAIKLTEAVPAPTAPAKSSMSAHLTEDVELNQVVSDYLLRTVDENAGETGAKTRKLIAQMFESGEDQNLLAASAKVIEDQLLTSRVVPDAVMIEDAADTVAALVGTNTDNVLRFFANAHGDIGSIKAASNILAHAQFVKTYSVAFRNALEEAITKQTPEAALALTEAKSNYTSLLKSFDKVRSGLGLSLRAVGKAEEGAKAGKAVRSLLDLSEEQLAAQMKTKEGRAEIQKILMGMGDGKNANSVAELSKFQRFMGVHNEYWINMGLLSAPKTSIANIIGNTLATLSMPAEILGGTLVNKAFGRANTLSISAALKPYALLLGQVGDSLSFMTKAFKTNATPFETLPMGEAFLSKKSITAEALGIKETANANLFKMTNFLGEVVRLPGRAMVTMDSFFKHLNSHAAAKLKLYDEAYKNGLSGEAADAFVGGKFKGLMDSSGSFFNKDAVVKKLHTEGKDLLREGKIKNIYEYIEAGLKKWEATDGNVVNFAKDYAERATFTTDLPRAGTVVGTHPDTGAVVSRTYNYDAIGAKVDDFINSHPVFKLALPFTKTPLNILNAVGQRMLPNNTIPGLKNLHRQYYADIISGDPVKMAMAEGRMVSGMALVTSTMALAYNGKLTGAGPMNDNERKALQATGWQPYSFVVENDDGTTEYVSYQRLDPIATFFGLAADITEFGKNAKNLNPEDYTNMVAGMAVAAANNITNKSYLSGIDQISNVMSDPYRFFDKFARTRVASYIPNFLRSAVGSFGDDPYMREARTFSEAIMRSLPGASNAVDVQRNILGEPIERKTLAPGLDYINPVSVSTKGNDFVMDEVARLQAAFSLPRTKQGDGLVDMLNYSNASGQSAFDRFMENTGEVKLNGKTLRQRLERLVNSADYKSVQEEGVFSVDSPRAGMIRSVISRYRDAALKQTRKEFFDFDRDMKTVERAKRNLKNGGRVTVDDFITLSK